jgi:hypothetical protein
MQTFEFSTFYNIYRYTVSAIITAVYLYFLWGEFNHMENGLFWFLLAYGLLIGWIWFFNLTTAYKVSIDDNKVNFKSAVSNSTVAINDVVSIKGTGVFRVKLVHAKGSVSLVTVKSLKPVISTLKQLNPQIEVNLSFF